MQRSKGLWRRMAGTGAVLTALLAPSPAALALDGDFSLGYDSNVGNAEHDADIRSARFVTAGLRAEHASRVGASTSLLLRGGLQAEAYDDYSGLNNGRLSGLARLAYRPSADMHAPAWSFWASAAQREFNSRLRDSGEYRAGVFMTKPLDRQFTARLSLAAFRRRAGDSEVFDLGNASAAADLDWVVTPALTLYGGILFQHGDVVSSATPSPGIRDVAEAREPDDVLRNRVAYRLDADTWIGTLGLNYGLTPVIALDVQAQHVDADAAGGNQYRRWICIAGLLARF